MPPYRPPKSPSRAILTALDARGDVVKVGDGVLFAVSPTTPLREGTVNSVGPRTFKVRWFPSKTVPTSFREQRIDHLACVRVVSR